MNRCPLLLTLLSLGWLAGCGGGTVHRFVKRSVKLAHPVFLSCQYYRHENGQWPNSKEQLVSFHARADFQATPYYAKLSRSDRKMLSALDWQRYHNMAIDHEPGHLRLRFDYRDERRGIDITGVRVGLVEVHYGWETAPCPLRTTDVASHSAGRDQ